MGCFSASADTWDSHEVDIIAGHRETGRIWFPELEKLWEWQAREGRKESTRVVFLDTLAFKMSAVGVGYKVMCQSNSERPRLELDMGAVLAF